MSWAARRCPRPWRLAAADDPASLALVGFAQWQGSGSILEQAEIQHGGEALHRAVARILPGGFTRVRVPVAADEPGPGARLAKNDQWWGETVLKRQLGVASELLRRAAPSTVVAVGGDAGIVPSSLGYLSQRYAGSLAVLWIGATPALNEPQGCSSGHFNDMSLRACLEPSLFGLEAVVPVPLRPAEAVLAGASSINQPEKRFMQEKGMIHCTPEVLTRAHRGRIVAYDGGLGSGAGQHIGALSSETLQHIGVVQQWRGLKHLYVHVDLGVLDASALPSLRMAPTQAHGGSGTNCRGLSPEVLLELMASVGHTWRSSPGPAGGIVGVSVSGFATEQRSMLTSWQQQQRRQHGGAGSEGGEELVCSMVAELLREREEGDDAVWVEQEQ